VPVVTSIIYIIVVFGSQYFFKDRDALQVNSVVAFHNLFLCLLSATMLIGVLIYIIPNILVSRNQKFSIVNG
jgi:hypothetical protein